VNTKIDFLSGFSPTMVKAAWKVTKVGNPPDTRLVINSAFVLVFPNPGAFLQFTAESRIMWVTNEFDERTFESSTPR